MLHDEMRSYLINALLAEQPQYADLTVPRDIDGQRRLLRSLMNVRYENAPMAGKYAHPRRTDPRLSQMRKTDDHQSAQ